MSDIINLLPDNIANQIAAGEVIQRPSNILKELVENAIDADAKSIKIIVEEGGKRSIQIIDDGKGMSSTDARMCFERHATSKIKAIDDIFNIKTMGFRGEALASIAAVANVVLKTKHATHEVGTMIEIENAKILNQEPTMMGNGTNILVKNLFFTVPARKHFLKPDKKEFDSIIDEFLRIAIPFFNTNFELWHNGKAIYTLPKTNFKNRILQIYKTYYNEADLIAINQEYNGMNFKGFLGKPDAARTSRGHQFFFVNQRFIKSNYLGHAISSSFVTLIAKEAFPTYFIFIDIDTTKIDVNVHPSKQEIKFQDEQTVYAFLNSAIRKTLTQYAVAPSINFENANTERLYEALHLPQNKNDEDKIKNGNLYQQFTQSKQAHFIESQSKQDWQSFYTPNNATENKQYEANNTAHIQGKEKEQGLFKLQDLQKEDWLNKTYLQFQNEYLITTYANVIVIIHQQLAHQIILYEQYSNSKEVAKTLSIPLLFPIIFTLNVEDKLLFQDFFMELNLLGYEINIKNEIEFEITALPQNANVQDAQTDIEKIIEAYKYLKPMYDITKNEKVIRCMSLKNSLKVGKKLKQEEMQSLVNQLFKCPNPLYTYGNMKSFIVIEHRALENLF